MALPPVTRQPLVPWPLGEQAEQALVAGRHDALVAMYATAGPVDRCRLVQDLAERLGEQGTTRWLDEAPDEPLAALVRAEQLLAAAWARRDGGDGGTAAEFAAVTFDTTLEWAAELCARASAAAPQDPTPWIVAQRSVAGDRGAVLAAARRWQDLDFFSYHGNIALLGMLHPRVAGTPGDMLDFAGHVHAQAPEGHPVHVVVARALIAGHGLRIAAGESSPQAESDYRAHADLLRRAHAASLGSPTWRRSWLEGDVRNMFAFALFHADLDTLAWAEMEALRGHMSDLPWRLKSPLGVLAYEAARAWLVRNVVRP